jgi:hypothetical protein
MEPLFYRLVGRKHADPGKPHISVEHDTSLGMFPLKASL